MKKKISYRLKNILVALAIPLILYMFLLITRPAAMGGFQIFNIMRQAILPTTLAWGITFACKLGLWHFGAGANVITGIIVGAGLGNLLGGNIYVIAICIVVTCTAFGLLTGLIYIKIRVPSIIATVSCMLILESIGALMWGGSGVTVDSSYSDFFNNTTVLISCFVLYFIFAYFLYTNTKYGFNLKAVSNNIRVSEQQGINVNRVKLISFVLVGLYAGFYGVLVLARSNRQTSITNMGSMDLVFTGIMCYFVAVALEKYVNLMIGVYIGGLTVQLIRFGIVALGISGQFNTAAVAIALLFFSAFSSESDAMLKAKSILRKRSV